MFTMKSSWAPLAVLGAVLAVNPGSTGTASAAGATGLPVMLRPCDANGTELDGPGYFVVTATPGTTTHLYALVGNKSQSRAIVSILAVDAATGVYGGVTANLGSEPRRLVGAWTHLSTGKVKLDPGKGEIVSFSLRVPKHTAPGQYVGALTAFVPAHETRRGRGFAFTVQTRLADDIVVTVPGPESWRFRSRGVTAELRTTGTYLIAHVRNTGSMMLKGWGYLWIWQPGRTKPILAAPLRIDTTLPRTALNYPLRLASHPRHGRYGFQLKLWWNGGHTAQHGSFQAG
ncbi:MAG: hypothetical protein ACR2JC_07170 [Chloroflexota bacterium]